MLELFSFVGFFVGIILFVKLTVFLIGISIGSFGRKIGLGVKWSSDKSEFAIVTGATGCLGNEYAREFASMGYNLVLISRNGEKLVQIARNFKEKYHIKTIKSICVDFSHQNWADKVKKELKDIGPIVALANCMSLSFPAKKFAEYPAGFNRDIVYVNVLAPLIMIELVLPKMVEQNSGVIINFSSQSGDFRFPFYSTFSASKAFINTLSQILAIEYSNKGIVIQNVKPLFVKSTMSAEVKPNWFLLSPESTESSAMQLVGIESSTYGHWKHKIGGLLLDSLVFIDSSSELSETSKMSDDDNKNPKSTSTPDSDNQTSSPGVSSPKPKIKSINEISSEGKTGQSKKLLDKPGKGLPSPDVDNELSKEKSSKMRVPSTPSLKIKSQDDSTTSLTPMKSQPISTGKQHKSPPKAKQTEIHKSPVKKAQDTEKTKIEPKEVEKSSKIMKQPPKEVEKSSKIMKQQSKEEDVNSVVINMKSDTVKEIPKIEKSDKKKVNSTVEKDVEAKTGKTS